MYIYIYIYIYTHTPIHKYTLNITKLYWFAGIGNFKLLSDIISFIYSRFTVSKVIIKCGHPGSETIDTKVCSLGK